MNAHPRTASFTSGDAGAIVVRPVRSVRAGAGQTSIGRFLLISASVVLETVIVVALVASSVGIGTASPEPGPGRVAPPRPLDYTIAPAPSYAAPTPSYVGPEPAPAPGLR